MSQAVGLEDNDTVGFQEVVNSKKGKIYKKSKKLENSTFMEAVPSTKKPNKSFPLQNQSSTALKKFPLSSTSHIKTELNNKKITAADKNSSEKNNDVSKNLRKETAWAKPLVVTEKGRQREGIVDSLVKSQSKKASHNKTPEFKIKNEEVLKDNSSNIHTSNTGTRESQKEIKEFLGKIAPHKSEEEIAKSVKPYVSQVQDQNITYVPALIKGEPALVPVDTGREIYYMHGNKGIVPQLEIPSVPVIVQPVVYVPVYPGFGFAQNENFSQLQASSLPQGFFQRQNEDLNHVSTAPSEGLKQNESSVLVEKNI